VICLKCGADGATKNGNNRAYCATGDHSFKLPPPSLNQPENLPDGVKLRGTSTLTDTRTGETVLQWVKTTADEAAREAALLALVKAMGEKLPKVSPRIASGKYVDDLLTVYPIGDPHVGMCSWPAETGDDWNLKIAEQMHCDAMHELVRTAPRSKQAVVVNLGDLYHRDGVNAETPRSKHPLDVDGRFMKMFQVGVKVMRRCIESALAKHERVHVISAAGNHDESSAQALAVLLAEVYENEPRVTVDLSPSVFYYYRWGRILLGVHHGHTCKPAALPGVMATDRAQDWGECKFRHWLVGHVHHQSVTEYPGVTVETFGTLAAKDAYATNGGWRSNRHMQSIVYHRGGWLVARAQVAADMFAEAA
jgi:hypothetical protein